METPIDKAANAMLAALAAMGQGWHTRAEIAAHLGKTKLNQLEAASLDHLAALGTIERQLAVAKRTNANQYEYRVKEGN